MTSTTNITEIQEHKEKDIDQKYGKDHDNRIADDRQPNAARTIQRAYRGHRTRRELKGLSLSPSTRWTEVTTPSNRDSHSIFTNISSYQAIKEAKYRDLTTPRPSRPQTSESFEQSESARTSSDAQKQWRRIGKIARRAGGDEYASDDNDTLSPSEQDERRQERLAQREERMKTARTMDLAYFLEMVDQHHRYGSHLRKYHAEWKKRPTHENFFYWLDYGEGREVSLGNCSREKLDSMKVRYLGREERVNYAVEVDPKGKLCWKRNGIRVNTNEEWRDSIKGIVRVEDEAPSPSPTLGFYVSSSNSSSLSSIDHSESESSGREKKRKPAVAAAVEYTWKDFIQDAKSKALDHRPFKHPPKEPDTSYNLYIGIKQSGAFQHSSFLHGARVSAAGLIKVKDGQLRYMQPRSGHYKPPASSFRAFVHSLQKRGVDMSIINVPKSYAVLMGIEGYYKGRQNVQKIKKALGLGKGSDDGSGDEEKEQERRRRMEKDGKDGRDTVETREGSDEGDLEKRSKDVGNGMD
ncbi:MAG: hypothetical protein Q9219_003667 [cf. Caloplaca sp. 3 TL-2023]